MKNALIKLLLYIIVSALAAAFVIQFALPQVLRAYIQTGIGSCSSIPILCMAPEDTQAVFKKDGQYAQELIPLEFPKTKLSVPKGFKVVEELVKKPYYKKKGPRTAEAVIYILYEPADFFIKLFPQVKEAGIKDNYAFMRSLMSAQETKVNNINDAFFVILKSIFTPNLGDQRDVKMIQFKSEGQSYFINYNLSGAINFFDCSIITQSGDFFKIYIKDTGKVLDLNKAFTIASGVSPS
ncbi:MAG: hypothetical protein WC937_03465 [Candidatus Omnitrophota bacterium]|jgi:hypothetical protein|nr:hypothetical protein [Candidatus Omnitrophota bacterium]MDD5518592.1 hypothetical protein [Candidatus Omnitrophota bacterium]